MPTSVIRYVNAASTQGGNGTTSATGSGDANRAYINLTQAIGSESAATPNLVTSDILLTIRCGGTGADGYQFPTVFPFTTDSTRYLIVETPLADRTSNPWVWSTSRYRLSVVASTAHSSRNATYVLRGLQIENTRNNADATIFSISPNAGGTNITIEECLLRLTGASSDKIFSTGAGNQGGTYTLRNNVMIASSTTVSSYACAFNETTTSAKAYLYNNTIISAKGSGILRTGTNQVTASNNLVSSSGLAFSGSMLQSYNASNDTSATGTGARTSQTFTFVDLANANYRLSINDTGARGYGTNLSSSAGFVTDYMQRTRVEPWDIGADRAILNMYYSCGDSTSDLKTGSPTVSITGSYASFSLAQTGNIGVGDEITYAGAQRAIITGKESTTRWLVRSPTGITDPVSTGSATVNSIKHAFASLDAAWSGYSGASYLSSSNLVTSDVSVNIACYRDSGQDAVGGATDPNSSTTSINNYIRLFTPTNTGSQCNSSQRHPGKWSTTQGFLLRGGNFHIISMNGSGTSRTAYVIFEGLQIESINTANADTTIFDRFDRTGLMIVDSCILKMSQTKAETQTGAQVGGDAGFVMKNSVIWATKTGSAATPWRLLSMTNGTLNGGNFLYNNTVYGGDYGYACNSTTVTIKNCIAANTAVSGFNGTSITPSYNASTDGSATGSNSRKNQTFSFTSASAGDYTLLSTDTGAKGYGVDLSTDANYPITTDNTGTTRTTPWDIGAIKALTTTVYQFVASLVKQTTSKVSFSKTTGGKVSIN